MLKESAFSEFKCERPTSLGMNVDSLGKILKMCGTSDSLRLRWKSEADTVTFQCEGGDQDRISEFDLKLMNIESEHMEIPDQQYKVVANLPSSEFQKNLQGPQRVWRDHVGESKQGGHRLQCSGRRR